MKKLNVNVNGNKKLQNDTKTRFIIWNLPAVKTCPYRTPMCEKSCYARKAERVYTQVLPSRERNFVDSMDENFVENMVYTVENLLKSKGFLNKKVVFRIHESGDFYNVEYTKKWIEICKHFEHNEQIVFLVYTKSINYIVQCGYGTSNFPKNLVVRSSLWKDTKKSMVELTYSYNMPIYTALTAAEMGAERQNGHKFAKCECKNCASCRVCWNASIKDIICEIH